ncbi:MAG: sulfur reduction protein DsrS, partial [Gammaproteobacteria bacterium]
MVSRHIASETELSNEDGLRLNVLLSQKLQAVRIDESRMMLYALTNKGEASVALNPNCREDRYLRHVRELLSTHILGSPGGYPVYINRWTRMGQDRDNTTLHNLLLLGEPEAVAAVVHAPGLTPELAELVWWVAPEAEHARRMLVQPQVAESEIAHDLARFLIEHLPFETEPNAIMDSVRLVLQPGLVSDDER